jgi:hypothetical protein
MRWTVWMGVLDGCTDKEKQIFMWDLSCIRARFGAFIGILYSGFDVIFLTHAFVE